MRLPEFDPAAFDDVPVNAWLGSRLERVAPGSAVVRLAVRPEFRQETGVVQGGILSALADTAAVYALWPSRSEGRAMTGVEFKVNFLRPAGVPGDDLVATSRLVRRGAAIGVVDVDLAQAGQRVLTGTFTFFFPPIVSPAPPAPAETAVGAAP